MMPLILNANLALAAKTLAKKHNVLVKRLPAIQNMGSVDILCTDKTGTLTNDKIELFTAISKSSDKTSNCTKDKGISITEQTARFDSK